MKLTCPSCGALMSLDIVVAHDGAREAVQIALQLPAPLGKLLIQYIALFRPKTRQLSLDRLATLLGELLPQIKDAQINRDGRIWPAPQEVWAAALEEIQNRHAKKPLSLPLKSHGYLLEIIVGIGEKAVAKAEAMREEQRQHRAEGQRTGAPISAADAAGKVAAARAALRK
ncbi:hypothetical protein [Methylocaldum sp.]|uniref:hypothetical protein n=1 Tax=Methylocaldum sp. TaxID=1969727 RepID=UPI002D560F5F|nr:hypothetical protein [Methylocaldum sp.]HYE35481.1 hypothetical protein [Methylocaldum sp.]